MPEAIFAPYVVPAPASEVLTAMREAAFAGGNPSSQHRLGQAARRAVERAEAHVLRLLATPRADFAYLGDDVEADARAIDFWLEQRAGGPGRVALPLHEPRWQPIVATLRRRGVVVCDVAPALAQVGNAAAVAELLAQLDVLALDAWQPASGAAAPLAALAGPAAAAGLSLHVSAGWPWGQQDLPLPCAQLASLTLPSQAIGGPAGLAALLAFAKGVQWPSPGTTPRELVVGFGAAAQCLPAGRDGRALAQRRDALEAALRPLGFVPQASAALRAASASLLRAPLASDALAALVAKCQQSGFNVRLMQIAEGSWGLRLWLDAAWPPSDDARLLAHLPAWVHGRS